MNLKGIFFFLGYYSLTVSFFALVNILYSLYFEFLLDINSYLICFIVSFIFGITSVYVGRKYKKNLKIFDQIFIIFLAYFLLPIFISIPYILSSYNFSILNSYFEAVSGFTSTGFSIIENISSIDNPLILWRSSSQWIGGLFFLISILSTLGTNILRIKPVYLLNDSSETINFYNNFSSNIFKIFFLYSLSTVIVLIFYFLSEIRFFDAFNLSFTTISAGGFLSKNNISSILTNDLQIFIFSLLLFFPILNFFLLYKLITNKFKIDDHYEDFYLILIVILLTLITYFFIIPNENFFTVFLMIVSSISTSGIGFYNSNFDLSLFLILITFIGGSVISCTSGFKFLRFYILIKASFSEMSRLVKPKNIFINRLFKTSYRIIDQDIKNCFFIFVFYILGIFILCSILTLDNIGFSNSFKLSMLTLTNTAASELFNFSNFNFIELTAMAKIFLIIFMVLGKLEFIALLVIAKKIIFKE